MISYVFISFFAVRTYNRQNKLIGILCSGNDNGDINHFRQNFGHFRRLRPIYKNRPLTSLTPSVGCFHIFAKKCRMRFRSNNLLSMGSLSLVESEPTRCSGGHRIDSCPGLRFFLRPTLVTRSPPSHALKIQTTNFLCPTLVPC